MTHVQDTTCPGCGIQPHPDIADIELSPSSVLTCPRCGYLGIWEGTAWRRPNSEEHAELVSSEDFLDTMSQLLLVQAWREKDQAVMRNIITEHIRWYHSESVAEELTKSLINAFTNAGFHTHNPESEDQ